MSTRDKLELLQRQRAEAEQGGGADRVAARMGARIAHYVPDKPDDLAQQQALVERAIGAEANLSFSKGMSSVGGPAAVAAVLNLLSATLEKEVLDLVAERDPL